jgi:hypothetical protein
MLTSPRIPRARVETPPRRALDHALDRALRRARDDEGAATAEYAITIMAAVGFAGLLVVILRSGEVQAILTDLVTRALTVAG